MQSPPCIGGVTLCTLHYAPSTKIHPTQHSANFALQRAFKVLGVAVGGVRLQASIGSRIREKFTLAQKQQTQSSCVMDAVIDAINSNLPATRRPLASLAHAGDLTPKVLAILAEKVPVEEIGDKIRALLDAKTKDGTRSDFRAVEAGLKIWLSYVVGLPVQRTENVNVNLDADAGAGLRERLAKSPALRSALRKALEDSEGETVEVESVAK